MFLKKILQGLGGFWTGPGLELLDKKVVVVLMLASLRRRSLSRPGFSRSRKRRGDCRKLRRPRLML